MHRRLCAVLSDDHHFSRVSPVVSIAIPLSGMLSRSANSAATRSSGVVSRPLLARILFCNMSCIYTPLFSCLMISVPQPFRPPILGNRRPSTRRLLGLLSQPLPPGTGPGHSGSVPGNQKAQFCLDNRPLATTTDHVFYSGQQQRHGGGTLTGVHKVESDPLRSRHAGTVETPTLSHGRQFQGSGLFHHRRDFAAARATRADERGHDWRSFAGAGPGVSGSIAKR